jgi:hypothetical protein
VRVARAWLSVFAIAVPLNFAWEMAQAPLYGPMGPLWQATWRCFVASLGDGVMVLTIVAVGSMVFGSGLWFAQSLIPRPLFAAVAGIVLALAVELWGVQTGRWSYRRGMPVLPEIDVAVVPLAQMGLLVPVTLWLTRTWLGRVAVRSE